MSDPSVIPTPATPDVCSVKILVDGDVVSDEFHVLSASVSRELNRIPAASVQLRDGEASKQTFEASDTDHFTPGKQIEVRLGYRGETETVFTGIIVKNRVRVRRNETLLSLECRDKAVRLTSGRKSRYFADVTDSDILEEIIGSYGLDRSVTPTQPEHKELVQYDSTDWDFVVCRAEANGHVVAVRDGAVSVAPPAVEAQPVVTVQFGATLLELDAEIDARWQVKGRKAAAWNATDQALVTAEASEPSVTDSGNLASSDLSDVIGGDPHVLRHGGKLAEPELRNWADGRLLKDRLAKVRGRARFQGFGGVTPGDVVEVDGIGKRFAGPQFVSGVRHTFANGNWETDVAFGLSPDTHADTYSVAASAAGGLLPPVHGLQIGLVTALEDPDGEDRIRVRLPVVSDADGGVWARLATLDAGNGRGTFIRPEIDDEVVVGFLDGDPRHPVVLGQLHSSAKPAPEAAKDDNNLKGYVSRSELKLMFDDDKKVVVLETPAGNRLTLSEDGTCVELVDQHGSSVKLDRAGITLESAKDLTLKAAGDLVVQGNSLKLAADVGLTATAQSSAEISSSGTLTLKGSLVRIN